MFFVSSEVTETIAADIIFVSGVGVVAGAGGRERRTGGREEMHKEGGHRAIVRSRDGRVLEFLIK